ncbi:MAG TPA: ribosome maturation factor RimM [Minicystis sp.]|nr:ribosome maturation factor RimM [Minicystis sp.]
MPGSRPRERSEGRDELVAIAEVARPHGVRGELRLKLYNEASNVLLSKPGVLLELDDGARRPAAIATARRVNRGLLVELVGVADRDAADALRGARVLVRRDALPPLDEGEFYACDVEGARVLLGGEEVGRVTSLEEYPTCAALVVAGPTGKFEVPLVDAYVASVDVAKGVVELVTLEGLR